MGLFDRLLGSRRTNQPASADQKKSEETFFLDPDASSGLGDVKFMRKPNTIRRTFPGNANSPGGKEMIQEVDSMAARLEKITPGMPGTEERINQVDLTGGIPKPVKKTFAERMSSAELSQRLKGTAISGTNQPGPAARKEVQESTEVQPTITQQSGKPGSTDAWRSVARDIIS